MQETILHEKPTGRLRWFNSGYWGSDNVLQQEWAVAYRYESEGQEPYEDEFCKWVDVPTETKP